MYSNAIMMKTNALNYKRKRDYTVLLPLIDDIDYLDKFRELIGKFEVLDLLSKDNQILVKGISKDLTSIIKKIEQLKEKNNL